MFKQNNSVGNFSTSTNSINSAGTITCKYAIINYNVINRFGENWIQCSNKKVKYDEVDIEKFCSICKYKEDI